MGREDGEESDEDERQGHGQVTKMIITCWARWKRRWLQVETPLRREGREYGENMGRMRRV